MEKKYRVFLMAMEVVALLGVFLVVNTSSFLGQPNFPDVTTFAGRGWGSCDSCACAGDAYLFYFYERYRF